MTVQDLFLTSYPIEKIDISARTALLVGSTLAAGLFWLAQGTGGASSGLSWHGNVGQVAADI